MQRHRRRDTNLNCSVGGPRAIRRLRPRSGTRAPEAVRPGRRSNKETSSRGFPEKDQLRSARRAKCSSRNRSAAPAAPDKRGRWTETRRIRSRDRRVQCDRWQNGRQRRYHPARRARTHARNDSIGESIAFSRTCRSRSQEVTIWSCGFSAMTLPLPSNVMRL